MIAPKVSICIPAFKQADLLRKALTSIFKQDYTNFEVIITDDSPDGSVGNMLKEFEQHPNIKYYKNTETKGSPENWNEAIRHATGEYIKILHHDDWFPKTDCLRAFVSMLDEHPEADFAFSGSLNYNMQGSLEFTHRARRYQVRNLRKDPAFLFLGNFIGAPSATIYRRGLDIFFDPKLKWVVDVDFYIRALYLNNNFTFTYNPLVAIAVGSEDRVTTACVNDRAIDLFENLYLYNKIAGKTTLDYAKFMRLLNLLQRYRVSSERDLIDCGYNGPLGPEIQSVLNIPKVSRIILNVSYCAKTLLSPRVWARFVSQGISSVRALVAGTSKLKSS